jgi:hypothetical protein
MTSEATTRRRHETTPIDLMALKASDTPRFLEKVDRRGDDECWLWTANTDINGYGMFWLNGRNRRASHASLALLKGIAIQTGFVACHHCDTPACVNPNHLFVGTLRDNALDAVRKGRIDMSKPSAINANALKTHCPSGHAYTPENIIHAKTGRICRQCSVEHNRRLREKRAREHALAWRSEVGRLRNLFAQLADAPDVCETARLFAINALKDSGYVR